MEYKDAVIKNLREMLQARDYEVSDLEKQVALLKKRLQYGDNPTPPKTKEYKPRSTRKIDRNNKKYETAFRK